jgi:hypothetical protein
MELARRLPSDTKVELGVLSGMLIGEIDDENSRSGR